MDPFTQVYQAIWAMLTGWSGFAQLVAAGNVIDLSQSSFEAPKLSVSAGDLPEAMLVQGAFALRPRGTSSVVAEATQTYPLLLTAPSLRVSDVNAIKYQALVAMAKRDETLGQSFVRRYTVREGQDGTELGALGIKLNRGTRRWVCAMAFEVEMYFGRGDLAAVAAG